MDQLGKVANPARGQLNREKENFPVRGRARESGLTRRVRPSHPAPAYSFSTLRLNLVHTHEIPLDFRGRVRLFIPPYAIGSVPSLSGHANAYRWRSLSRVRWHRARVVLKVVRVTGAAFAVITMDQLICASLFRYLLLV